MGVYKGRKQGSIEPYATFVKKPKVKKVKLMLSEGISIRKMCKLLECSPNFIYKVKERLELAA
jgi:DNA invertase Pin-like site-specific DNA recombinase